MQHLLTSVLHFGWLMETSSPQDNEENKANEAMIENSKKVVKNLLFLLKIQNREI